MDDTPSIDDTQRSAEEIASSRQGTVDETYLCPICLQHVDEPCYIDPCYHLYCLACITQWMPRSQRCPLCNTPAKSLIIYDSHTNEPTKLPTTTSFPAARSSPYGRNPTLARAASALGVRKRQAVYAHNLHRVPSTTRRARISQNPVLLYRELSTERCKTWIRRDLQVLLGAQDVGLFEHVVVAAMREKQAAEALRGMLGSSAGRFVEELREFVDSGLDVEAYDRFVAYDTGRTLEGNAEGVLEEHAVRAV
ncbi:hypothetical protein IW150_004128 [Coemansia sp. RSA 2607]|nr:hypothetical protein IW150_004128 [Coemansia sp. RSA 2607]